MVDFENDAVTEQVTLLTVNDHHDHAKNAVDSEDKSIWKDTTARQKTILLLITFGHTVVFMCVSVPFAFLAKFVTNRGGNPEEAALLAQLVMLVMAVSSGFFGKYQVYLGSKALCLVGLLCFGIGQAMFGFLEFANDMITIVVAGSGIKILQGCGQGAYLVAAVTIICQEFPGHAGKAFSIVETFGAAGYTCGSLLGSLLFQISNNILLPHLISSLLIIPVLLIANCLLKSYTTNSNDFEAFKPTQLFTNPIAVLIIGIVFSTYGSFGSIDALSVIYLTPLGFGAVEVGLALVVASGTFGIASMMVGFASSYGDKLRRTMLIIGVLGMCTVTYLFTPTLPKPWVYTVIALYGVLAAMIQMSSFGELFHIAVDGRMELMNNYAMHSALSGVWNLVFGFGSFAFPIITSSLLRVVSFRFAVSISYMVGIGTTMIGVSILAMWNCNMNRTAMDK